ncbi:MAG: hypothetical protein Q4F35_02820, partial [Akkermansia sp.]|nr:hypothetical protein [Akkermansia sp.]
SIFQKKSDFAQIIIDSIGALRALFSKGCLFMFLRAIGDCLACVCLAIGIAPTDRAFGPPVARKWQWS